MSEQLTSQQVIQITRDTNFGTWRRLSEWNPRHMADAEGCDIIDADGKRYLDFSAQLMCSNLGHKNPAVIAAIAEQAQQLAYVMPGYTTTARAELSQLLLEVLPKGLQRFFFCTGGAEANEAAIKIARMATGKRKIIARYRSYHGATSAAMTVTGDARRMPSEPLNGMPNILHAPEAYCYRCPMGLKHSSCGTACANYLEHMIVNEGDVAAVIVEPVVGTNGVIVPPDEYMPRLREICTKHNVLLIADEVMAGWGRTGKWFAVEHWGVEPDMLVTAKGITGAYVPLGLVAVNERVSEHFRDNMFAHGHTYEAHPITLKPAVATIREMQRLGLVQRAAELEPYMREKLLELKRKHISIGEVRGKGLFWAIEIVKDRATREPFAAYSDKIAGRPLLTEQIAAKCFADGVSIYGWISHFVIAPPLIITKEQIDFAISVIDRHLGMADEMATPQQDAELVTA